MQKPKCIVIGGSFNPPTKAHLQLLQDAMKQTNADMGIFVPSSHAYVSRKMSRLQKDNQVFTESERLRMLQALIQNDPRLQIDTCEYGDNGCGHTYETMVKLQKKHPNYTMMFLTGADKLTIIPRWHNHDKFFNEFEFVVATRNLSAYNNTDTSNVLQIIETHPVLRKYKHIFHVIQPDPSIANISSSELRQRMGHRSVEDMLKLIENGA